MINNISKIFKICGQHGLYIAVLVTFILHLSGCNVCHLPIRGCGSDKTDWYEIGREHGLRFSYLSDPNNDNKFKIIRKIDEGHKGVAEVECKPNEVSYHFMPTSDQNKQDIDHVSEVRALLLSIKRNNPETLTLTDGVAKEVLLIYKTAIEVGLLLIKIDAKTRERIAAMHSDELQKLDELHKLKKDGKESGEKEGSHEEVSDEDEEGQQELELDLDREKEKFESESESASDTETESKSESKSDSTSESKSDSETETETETESDSTSESESATESETATESKSGFESKSDSGAGSEEYDIDSATIKRAKSKPSVKKKRK